MPKVDLRAVLHTLSDISDMRDFITGSHGVRVALLSRLVAEKMKLPPDKQEIVYYAGLIHDIGKFAVPEFILRKAGKLKPDEFEIIKRHSYFTGEILRRFIDKDNDWYSIAEYAEMHHERLDGSGYPNGSRKEEIPVEARIVAVTDVFDVMSAKRLYAKRRTIHYICKELAKEVKNGRMDKDVVDALEKATLKELLVIIEYDEHYKHEMIEQDEILQNVSLNKYCDILAKRKKSAEDRAIINRFEQFYQYEVHKQ